MEQEASQHSVTHEPGMSQSYYLKACVSCKTKHRVCGRELPGCKQCSMKGITCYYAPPKKRGRPHRAPDRVMETQSHGTEVQHTTAQNHNVLSRVLSTCLDERINYAQWLTTRALVFINMQYKPLFAQSECARIGQQIAIISPSVDTSELYSLTQRLSRTELCEHSVAMFHKAKEVVLHPDVFPYIASNATLSYVCFGLALHLVVERKQIVPESLLFSAAAKVFVKANKHLANVDVSMLPDIERSKALVHRNSILIVTISYYFSKIIYRLNSDIQNLSLEDMENVFHWIHTISKYIVFMEQNVFYRSVMNHLSEGIKKFSTLQGVARVTAIVEPLEEFLVHVVNSWFKAPESARVVVRGLQLLTITIAIKTIQGSGDKLLKLLQLKYINLLSMLLTENIFSGMLATIAHRLCLYVCEIHIQQCDQLLSNPILDTMIFSDMLAFVQSDLILLDRLNRCAPFPLYQEILQQLNSRLLVIIAAMQEVHNIKEQPASQEDSCLTRPNANQTNAIEVDSVTSWDTEDFDFNFDL